MQAVFYKLSHSSSIIALGKVRIQLYKKQSEQTARDIWTG